ncbi:resolvase, N-terminal domain protein [Streptomyces ipomoeae 91-03]|uniref:Resolvase, N-terminal domain protein n=2 Tax=Streptomyces ipomoeae TaxID=103232 RepID=L1KQL9_9ACTN|nr:resolvase, N-terminal domain protein [Streptomyces ipomoeae 91-03]
MVAPYARISDTDEERAPGIDRQLRTVHPLITSRDAVKARDYIDNDKSAFKPEVFRDDFEAWLQDFIDGKNDGIAAWDLDRIFRQNGDLERVIKAYCHAYYKEGRPKPVLWLPSMTIDLTDPDAQVIARVLVAVANQSSAKTVKRVTDFYRDEALKGKIYSNYPAFYRNKDGSINPEKAAITFKAIEDVFSGVRPTAIADEWRTKSITTARGGRVNGDSVRRILVDPGIAGLAVYRKELLIGPDGNPIQRQDGGLIDEATWRALCKELEAQPGRRRKPTKALLSKFLRCGLCGSRMVRTRKTDTYFTYSCQSVDAGGCARVAISGPKLDKQITTLVLAYLSQPIDAVEEKPFEGQSRLDEVTAKIAELMTAYRTGAMSGSIVFPSIKELEDEQKLLQSQAAKHVRTKRKVTTAADEWDHIGLERQQSIISEVFVVIVIEPASNPKAGVYEAERAKPVWRSPEQ